MDMVMGLLSTLLAENQEPISTCSMTQSTISLRDGVHWLQLGSHTDLSFRLNLDNLGLSASRISRMPSIYLHL